MLVRNITGDQGGIAQSSASVDGRGVQMGPKAASFFVHSVWSKGILWGRPKRRSRPREGQMMNGVMQLVQMHSAHNSQTRQSGRSNLFNRVCAMQLVADMGMQGLCGKKILPRMKVRRQLHWGKAMSKVHCISRIGKTSIARLQSICLHCCCLAFAWSRLPSELWNSTTDCSVYRVCFLHCILASVPSFRSLAGSGDMLASMGFRVQTGHSRPPCLRWVLAGHDGEKNRYRLVKYAGRATPACMASVKSLPEFV